MGASFSREDIQAAKQRQSKLDETQRQIDAALQKALLEFVEARISPGATISQSWCLWECTWQKDTGNLDIFLDCESSLDTCYLLVSYLPSLTNFNTFEATIGYLNQ